MDGFLDGIKKSFSLVDVAAKGTATQSSYSKWSKDNDPQRAVNEESVGDFAFHTDKGNHSWWMLDLKKSYFIDTIILNNRKNPAFQDKAKNLVIDFSNDNSNWFTVYSGGCVFGALPDSLPLILRVGLDQPVRYIRLSVFEEDYLHLSKIHVLVKGDELLQSKKIIYAARSDGLGERFRAILNAMAIAHAFGYDFKFFWQDSRWIMNSDFHSVDYAKNIFSDSFLNKYLLKEDISKKSYSLDKINDNDFNIIKVEQGSGFKFLNEYLHDSKKLSKKSLKKAFETIEFSDKIQNVINRAKSIDLNDVVALHLRAGDVIYGDFVLGGAYVGKAIPFYIAFDIIELLMGKGKRVMVFGQDGELIDFLVAKYGVLDSRIYSLSEYDKTQQAFFEIIMMSNCCEIISGSSGFAVLASNIGNIKNTSHTNLFKDKDRSLRMLSFLKDEYGKGGFGVSRYQVSYGCLAALKYSADHLDYDDLIFLAKVGFDCNSENIYFLFFLICIDFNKNKNFYFFENDLERLIFLKIKKFKNFIKFSFGTPYLIKQFSVGYFFNPLKEVAIRGGVHAASILYIYNKKAGRGLEDFDSLVGKGFMEKNRKKLMEVVNFIES
ncbi:discoidin domain-containing protein [Paenalcaligenes faecalis]|uniref:discoidin domain-containing protein n=1 Tax=Paenalcaligenes faecalis TaxID=2980099 RepID=UPI0022B966EA|nr:discoidin domain-containing protein [Paenalcaligenes faecalis]